LVAAKSPPQRPWWRRWWSIGIAVVVIIMIIGALSPDSKGDRSPQVTPTLSDAVAQNESPKKIKKAIVPLVKGLGLSQARRELRASHLRAGLVQRRPSALPRGTVLSQGLRGGKHLAYGSVVPLVIAAPLPRVPFVRGKAQATAAAVLRTAGFRVVVHHQTTTSGNEGVVLSQSPAGGTAVRPHVLVTIVVSHVIRPVVAAPAPSNCTPGYSPCLPPAPDYDCSGGSGNGPKYTGLVRVTGSDPYELDADGDGWGCGT
jgi:hypothetical protein